MSEFSHSRFVFHVADKPKHATVVAQFDYVPFSRDELHFEAGDVIEVLMKRVDGWWKGRCGEQEGWFPSTFVVEIESDNEPKGNTANGDTRSSPFRTMEGKIMFIVLL